MNCDPCVVTKEGAATAWSTAVPKIVASTKATMAQRSSFAIEDGLRRLGLPAARKSGRPPRSAIPGRHCRGARIDFPPTQIPDVLLAGQGKMGRPAGLSYSCLTLGTGFSCVSPCSSGTKKTSGPRRSTFHYPMASKSDLLVGHCSDLLRAVYLSCCHFPPLVLFRVQ